MKKTLIKRYVYLTSSILALVIIVIKTKLPENYLLIFFISILFIVTLKFVIHGNKMSDKDYKIYRIIFMTTLAIILWASFSYLHIRYIQRSMEYGNYVRLVEIYREYSSTGFLKHENRYVNNAFIYTNPIVVYGTNFFPVIEIRYFFNDDASESYFINKNEDVILVDKNQKIKFLHFKYKD